MMFRQKTLKSKLLTELKTEYKAFFESRLAVALLTESKALPAVSKISKEIVNLIEKNFAMAIKLIKENNKITKELFGKQYFGRLKSKEQISPQIILEKILEVLQDEYSSLDKVMQIHAIFTYRMLPHLKSIDKSLIKIKGLTSKPVINKKD